MRRRLIPGLLTGDVWIGNTVVPTVAVVRGGRVVASQGNVATADEAAALVAQAEGAP